MIVGKPGITMAEVIGGLTPERRDEVFLALLHKALGLNPRLSTVAGIAKALGEVEGPTFLATLRFKTIDPQADALFIDMCQRLGVDDKRIARFLLRA